MNLTSSSKPTDIETPPLVSIVVLTHDHPVVFQRLLDSLPMTTQVPYEVVVVDNGSQQESTDILKAYESAGFIQTLVLEPINHFFSQGNNIGVHHSNPASPYILLLNSDVEILLPEWLHRAVQWMEGVPDTFLPYTWSDHAPTPTPEPRDIVSIGWSYDEAVPGCARLEGWCYLIRRSLWRDISPDFPFYWGLEERMAELLRSGARAGCLCQYSRYLIHYEGGCETWKIKDQIVNKRQPNHRKWFANCTPVETLDFTLGPHEHQSYCEW